MSKLETLSAIKSTLAIIILALLATIVLSIFTPAEAIEQDKVLHLTGSAAISYGVNDTFKETVHPVIYPFALTMSLGLLKEMAVDMEVDRNDLAADAVGAFIGTVAANQDRILPSWSNTDKYLLESYVAMSAIDVWQTRKCLDRVNCQEGNTTLYGSTPSATRLTVVHAAGGYLIYMLADSLQEGRTTMLVAVNLIQFAVVRSNYFIVGF